jgi:hypothetical protein
VVVIGERVHIVWCSLIGTGKGGCRERERERRGLDALGRHVLWCYDMGSMADSCTDSVHPVAVLHELGSVPVGVRWNASA